MKNKLKTSIIYSFDIEKDLMNGINFNMEIQPKNIKRKLKITEFKKRKKDGSTGLF